MITSIPLLAWPLLSFAEEQAVSVPKAFRASPPSVHRPIFPLSASPRSTTPTAKSTFSGFPIRPVISHAGADIIALDCTHRRLTQPEPWPEIIRRIHTELGRPVCADIATIDDALAAQRPVPTSSATTLCGYTADTAGIRTPPPGLSSRPS